MWWRVGNALGVRKRVIRVTMLSVDREYAAWLASAFQFRDATNEIVGPEQLVADIRRVPFQVRELGARSGENATTTADADGHVARGHDESRRSNCGQWS